MMRSMLKSKVHSATITDLQLHYKGSITIDEEILDAADLLEGEKVEVLNLNNGIRLQTYVIKGERGSGTICLNGPAARLGYAGDEIVILSYGLYSSEELDDLEARIIELDGENRIIE